MYLYIRKKHVYNQRETEKRETEEWAVQARLSLLLSKYHTVGNHMSLPNFIHDTPFFPMKKEPVHRPMSRVTLLFDCFNQP